MPEAVTGSKPVIGQRVIGFDLLRGLAALAVAIPHFFLLFHHNAMMESISIIAVEIFFGLSGYVLAPQVIKLHRNASNYNLWVFFLRRWIRTITPYLFALVLIAFLTANLFTGEFFKKIVFVDTFTSVSNTDFFAISWSLAVEEWYYVTAALLVFIFRKSKVSTIFIGACLMFFIIKTAGMFLDADWNVAVRRATIYRLDAIAFGFLMFLFKDRINLKWPAAILAVLVTLGITVAFLAAFKNGIAGFKNVFMLGAIYALSAFSLSVVYLFGLVDPLIARLKMFKLSEFLGNISYPVYLFHLPFAYAFASLKLDMMTAVLLALASTVLFSWLFHELIERSLIFGRPRYKDEYEARLSDGRQAGRTPWSILQGWAMGLAGFALVAALVEVGGKAYLKQKKPTLQAELFKTEKNYTKTGTMHVLGALDPQLGYAHPRRLDFETKPYAVSQWDGYGVHRPKQGDFYKVYILGGSTSDPFLSIKKKEAPWSKFFYQECRTLKNCGVWNAGVGGYGSPQELLKLVRDIVPERPDLVLSLHGPNELNRLRRAPFTTGFSNEQMIKESRRGKLWLNNLWPNTFAALAYLRRNDDQPTRPREIHYGYNYSKRTPFENWKTNVEMMHAISKSQGITYITALQPLIGYSNYQPTEKVLATGSKRGKTYYNTVAEFYEQATEFCATVEYCVDLSLVFEGHPPGLYTDIRHPNEAGNEIIAKELATELIKMGVLESNEPLVSP